MNTVEETVEKIFKEKVNPEKFPFSASEFVKGVYWLTLGGFTNRKKYDLAWSIHTPLHECIICNHGPNSTN